MKTSRVDAKGTKLVVRHVGLARETEAGRLQKNACYVRVVKPTYIQYTAANRSGLGQKRLENDNFALKGR
jgi:hypothetical protein